jgi:hypothetical protein
MLADSMVSLELTWIFGLSANEFLNPDGIDDGDGRMKTGSTVRRRSVILPLISKLRCALRFGEFRELQRIIGCCPSLLDHTIIPVDLDRIARGILIYCPKI